MGAPRDPEQKQRQIKVDPEPHLIGDYSPNLALISSPISSGVGALFIHDQTDRGIDLLRLETPELLRLA